MHIFTVNISQTVTTRSDGTVSEVVRMLLDGFRIFYLQLTLAHCNGQSLGSANFDYEYLLYGDKRDKYCSCQWLGSRLFAFDWCIYIWPWPILKVKVKAMLILTVNISHTMTNMINIAIANTLEVVYWLSIGVFKCDICQF